MAKLTQGEIWWADVPPPIGHRPVLILTRTSALAVLSNVTVAPLTRTRRAIPSEVDLRPAADGVPTACAISLENIFTMPKAQLDRRITRLSARRMDAVFDAVRFAFGMT